MFDLSMAESFRTNWRRSFGKVNDDLVCVIRPSFRGEDQIGESSCNGDETGIGRVRVAEVDICLSQRCYSREEVAAILQVVGFSTFTFSIWAQRANGKDFFCCLA